MRFCKLQIGCMLIVLYVGFMYLREKYAYGIKKREPVFEGLLAAGILSIAFDGATACTVNYLGQVPDALNGVLHLLFLSSLDVIEFLMFLYIIEICRGVPRRLPGRFLIALPLILNLAAVLLFMPKLEYRHGEISNYSMGIPVYICFAMLAAYLLVSLIVLFVCYRNLGHNKFITISTYIAVSVGVAVYQGFNPQALVTCIAPTLAVVAAYLNLENPLFTKLHIYNSNMVSGFATLVENRDENTGGHIKRTTDYVRLLACEMKARKIYRKTLTNDYIKNLVMAAPMHDVGKIAVPDSILLKPGKLTAGEFDIMKTHAERGGKIIRETFSGMGDDEYEKMAYEVARHHHEKWNGKGYPDKLSENEIPLCARIMAVADVFDAVSAKRCYRDALPLEECFKIIESGIGTDFDPMVARTFLDIKEKITEIALRQPAQPLQ